jgi:hypothetical protein
MHTYRNHGDLLCSKITFTHICENYMLFSSDVYIIIPIFTLFFSSMGEMYCIMSCTVVYILYEILLGLSNQGG